jgi:hypothetical protein
MSSSITSRRVSVFLDVAFLTEQTADCRPPEGVFLVTNYLSKPLPVIHSLIYCPIRVSVFLDVAFLAELPLTVYGGWRWTSCTEILFFYFRPFSKVYRIKKKRSLDTISKNLLSTVFQK